MKQPSTRAALRALLTASLVAAALTIPAAPASADRHSALKRDLGLTDAQVTRLREAEAEAMDREARLRDALGSAFGGLYLDAASGDLTVAVTDPEAVSAVERTGAAAEVVAFGESALNGFADSLTAASGHADARVTGWYVDVADDSVVITVREGGAAAAEDLARRAGIDERAVRVAESDQQPRPFADLVGGTSYHVGDHTCSIGFPVRRGSESGFVTAGHCGEEGARTSDPEGTVAGRYFPGRDMGWVRATGTPTPLVTRHGGEDVTVTGSREAAVGSSVCRSGSATGWRCGTIRSKNQTIRYPDGTVSGLTRTDVCAEGGDSGGPWLTGTQGQGVTSGGSGDCVGGGVTYFQPLNPILSHFGLTLVTG